MNKFVLTVLLTGLLLAGCAGQPSQQELAVADYGPAPDTTTIEFYKAVERAIKSTLKDPDSLKELLVTNAQKCMRRAATAEYGYCILIAYNAKNSYGGYVGQRPFTVFVHDGHITDLKAYAGGPDNVF